MTLTIELSAEDERRLRERASLAGQDPAGYLNHLIRAHMGTGRTFAQILAPVHAEFHASGMSPDELERCFDLYWSTKRDGTGLGLSTVARIVEEHEGSIGVVSEKGRGTSFSIVLPLIVELAGRTPGAEATEGQGSSA